MTVILSPRGKYLASAQAAEGSGNGGEIDSRLCPNYGFLFYQASGNSAVFTLQGSHDMTAWLPVATYTATATQTGTAQIDGYFPYMRLNVDKVASAAGGSGVIWVHHTQGL